MWKPRFCSLGSSEGIAGLEFVKSDLPAGLWLELNMQPEGVAAFALIYNRMFASGLLNHTWGRAQVSRFFIA